MKDIRVCLFFFCALVSQIISSQPRFHIDHYDLIDGLPQRTVMSIIQDHKGFMWFSTWDGLCRFDGYNFISYKTASSDSIVMKSNRINKIVEDKNGYIWVHNYYQETFCFDPVLEKYIAAFAVDGVPFKTHSILPMLSGDVWLTSKTMGAICISGIPQNYRHLTAANSLLTTDNIHTVYEDSVGGSWLLTDAGLVYENNHVDTPVREAYYTSLSDNIGFFCAYETDKYIYFGADKGRIYCYNKNKKYFKVIDTECKSGIISIQKVTDNRLLLLTERDGFLISNNEIKNISVYNIHNTPEILSNRCISAYVDREQNIWLETERNEVIRFDFLKNVFRSYTAGVANKSNLHDLADYYILEDHAGNVWIHPRGGGFSYYDRKSDSLKPFRNKTFSPNWGFSDILHACYLDSQGNMWLSTRTDGLEKIVFEQETFHLNYFMESQGKELQYGIRTIFEDSMKRIWTGCNDGVIRIFNSQKEYLGYLCNNGKISRSGIPLRGIAYCFYQDVNRHLYIGTKGDGLYHLTPKSESEYTIIHYKNDPNDSYSLSSNNIYTFYKDDYHHFWIGSYGGGLNLWDGHSNRFLNANNLLEQYPNKIGRFIRHINSDCHGNIYVASTFGLIVFKSDITELQEITFKIYTNLQNELKASQGNDILNVYTTTAGDTYICTYGGGLSKVLSWDSLGYPLKFVRYDKKGELPSDVVLSIIEDTEKKLWIATEGCVSRFDPQAGTFEAFSDVVRLLQRNYISESAPVCLHTGEIIFGCLKGTLAFQPSNVISDSYIPSLVFIGLYVSGKKINIGNNGDEIEEIHLNHDENTFNIEYVALDYSAPFNIRYAYWLEGVDKQWVYNSKQRSVNYSNIAPGNYVFKVHSTDSNGNWVENEQCIKIVIHPSFWQTNWAYAIYIFTIILVVVIILYSIIMFYRMKDKIALEEEQIELKTKFFTDISHEIRTPLTMIVSPVENIIESEKLPQVIHQQLKSVLQNANRMLMMVNQILDFRKIQKQKLKIQEIAIGVYVTDVCNNFFKISCGKEIQFSVFNRVGTDTIWGDCYDIEKLVFNLMSNAIKFTPVGKSIEVIIFRKDMSIAIQVRDEGEGMDKEVKNKIFTRFESFNTDKSKPSTGIGLSIVKEVADKHHARITVESEKNRGAVFTVYFPINKDIFQQDENVEFVYDLPVPKEQVKESLCDEEMDENENEDADVEDNDISIVVVEDDTDLRNFICSMLSQEYMVYEAANGREGYEIAVEKSPDFILSDIMMPEMDGMELLSKVRNNMETSHIPVILLTAKTSMDDRLQGIESGADDYITKPFNVRLLKAKINTIISQRRRFYDHFTRVSSDLLEETGQESTKLVSTILPQDEKFLLEVEKIIEENLDNSEYIVEDLVATTRFSRRIFSNKLKSLTGLTPVEFVRDVRLKHAARLLKEGYYVKEVTYMVGFSDPKYFIRCFKKKYHVTPSQYMKTN